MQTYALKTKKSNNRRPEVMHELDSTQPMNSEKINLSTGRSLELPEVLRSRVQTQFGFSPDSIRIRESAQVADMGAKAAAQGNVISFAPGVYDPYSEAGQTLIGHELHHIAEQARGLGANVPGGAIHYNRSSEAASDISGSMFASGGSIASAAPVTPMSVSAAPVQGFFKKLMNLFKRKPKEKTENFIRDEEWDNLNECDNRAYALHGQKDEYGEYDDDYNQDPHYYDYIKGYITKDKFMELYNVGKQGNSENYGSKKMETEPVVNSRGGGGLMSKLWSGIKGIGSGIANKFKRRKTEYKFGETIID
jgi:hypothetical protein